MIRPADANETAVAWRVAIETRDRPVLLVLTRQDVPTLDRGTLASAEGLRRGAYVLSRRAERPPELILIASGSEVGLIVAAAERSGRRGHRGALRLDAELGAVRGAAAGYRDEVLPPAVTARLAVELGVSQGWDRYIGDARRHARRRPLRRLGARPRSCCASTASPSTTSSRAPGGSLPPDDVARCTRRRSDGPDVPGARRQGAVGAKHAAPPAAEIVRVLRQGMRSGERTDPRQDGARLASEHRRHRHGLDRLSGRGQARIHRPGRRRRGGP